MYGMDERKGFESAGMAMPEVTIMQFGLEETGCPLLIKNTIEHVRALC
jgi:hypothetical protein